MGLEPPEDPTMAKTKQTRTSTNKQAATQTQTQQADSSSTNEVTEQATDNEKPAFGLGFNSNELQSHLEVDGPGLATHRMKQILSLAWFEKDEGQEKIKERMVDAMKLYESLAPQDAVEAMLCKQMVGNTLAINACFQRAATNRHIDNSTKFLKSAAQLQGQFIKQIAALDKHRGRNHQKVVVEHVHVEAGGQAIVGNVETTAANQPDRDSKP